MSETPSQQEEMLWNIKSEEEQTDSKDWFQSETNYETEYTHVVDTAASMAADVFQCGVGGGDCGHETSHPCLNIKPEPTFMEDADIETDDNDLYITLVDETLALLNSSGNIDSVTYGASSTIGDADVLPILTSESKNDPPSLSTTTEFMCGICGHYFTTKGNLKQHLAHHYAGEFKPFTCSMCSKSFTTKGNLKRHQVVHSDKRFTCEHCGYTCCQKSNLKSHLRIHSGEKPFSCAMCKEAFAHRSSLVRHVKTHSEERAYQCRICGYQCSDKITLNRHVSTHSHFSLKTHSKGVALLCYGSI